MPTSNIAPAKTLPVFPLGTVLLPGGVLPLRIFERRYLDMVKQQLRDEAPFVICGVESGTEVQTSENAAPAVPYGVGTTVRIIDFDPIEDGTLGITVRGEQRVAIANPRYPNGDLCVADIEPITDSEPETVPEPLLSFYDVIEEMQQRLGPPWSVEPVVHDNADWLSSRMTELLPWSLAFKQQLLEEDSGLTRLKWMLAELPKVEFVA